MTDYKLAQKRIVDELAQFIRQVDGNNKMGAGSLAEKICERFRVYAPDVQGEPVGWQCVWPGGGVYTTDSYESAKNYREGAVSAHGEDQAPFIRPLYTAPQPTEQQPAPDVTGLVEALEAALMVMTSKEVRLEKQADAITMARDALAAHRKQGVRYDGAHSSKWRIPTMTTNKPTEVKK